MSKPIVEYNEDDYRAELIQAGLSPATAAEVAAKMAENRRIPSSSSIEETTIQPATPAKKPRASNKIVKSPRKESASSSNEMAVYDYQAGQLPDRVRELIETHLAIEAEDAKSAGTLGFMTRSLAIATLPHRRIKDYRFVRKNGDFTLTMMTAHPEGLPYGTLPRLLLTWVCTEVAQQRQRELSLGPNLASYLAELGLHSTGGKRGDITRLKHAMTTLFSSVISCHYEGKDKWALQNVLLADGVDWWTPQNPEEAGEWQSRVFLSERFFNECVEHKLPFDMRAIRALRQSPLALDIYVWLTHRMSYLSKRTTIPWISLSGQFGAGYAVTDQGLRDFKRAFLRELKHVQIIYPAARVSDSRNGLVLYPSPTHVSASVSVAIPSTPRQLSLL
ncbi:replication protein RepA [Methylomonas sp. ZR1]|uniref:replication protein RepA n=1 Tax=Methylomonas sp. ZR1 TaxID=1797072 RepID=UPI0014915518|nr:replication protein RepA [Methylomonas sp. ZR1]NOV32724.1 plasmid encoded RepA protein [Methylomonas sp. ZR1]